MARRVPCRRSGIGVRKVRFSSERRAGEPGEPSASARASSWHRTADSGEVEIASTWERVSSRRRAADSGEADVPSSADPIRYEIRFPGLPGIWELLATTTGRSSWGLPTNTSVQIRGKSVDDVEIVVQ